MELAKLVLNNNIFEFSDKPYKQFCGTAINTKFAPKFSSKFALFMEALEKNILSKVKKKSSVW